MSHPHLDEADDVPLIPPQIPRTGSRPARSTVEEAGATIPTPEASGQPHETEPRPNDPGEDRPPQLPAQLLPLSESDRAAIARAEETQLMREMREADELLASEPGLLGLPAFLSHPIVGSAMLGVAALLGLFLFNQVTSVLGTLATLSPTWQYVGYSGLILLSLLVLFAIGRFVWLYFRFRRNKQLRLKGLEELEKRTRLRWLVNAKVKEAKQQLIHYIQEFPLESKRDRKRLIAMGLTEEVIGRLQEVKAMLLDENRWPGDDIWFAAFRDQFQSRLDEAAQARVNYWARRTAVATAVSPNTLTDTMMTLYFSFTMLADLCTIYHLRAGRLGTMVLLARVFFNSYLAGQINEMEGLAAEQIQDWVAPHLPVSELVVAKVLGKAGAKAGAGVINYFLLSRLGKYGVRLLRPVSRD